MKIACERKAMAAALAPVVKVLKRADPIPFMTAVRIVAEGDTVTLTGDNTDMRVSAPCAATVERPGALVLPGHLLNDMARRSSDSAMAIEQVDDVKVAIRVGKARFVVPFLRAADFPDTFRMEDGASFAAPGPAFAKAMARTLFSADEGKSRFYLAGVYLHAHEDDAGSALRFVTTNGHVLSCSEIPLPEGAAGLPGIIVPTETAAEIARLAADSAEVQITATERIIVARFATGVTLASKLVAATYPDYLRIVPAATDRIATLDRAALTEAMNRIDLLAEKKSTAFTLDADSLAMAAESEKGAIRDEIEAGVSDGAAGARVHLNAAYVRDILLSLDCDRVEIDLSSIGVANTFRPAGATTPFSLCMPMKG